VKKLLTATLGAASMALTSYATMTKPSSEQAAQIGTVIDRAQAVFDCIA